MNFATLGDALGARRSSHHAVHFIEGDNAERTLAFGELFSRALGLLHHFQACGAGPGSEMILLVDRNEQLIDAFWACVFDGIVADYPSPDWIDAYRLPLSRHDQHVNNPASRADRRL